MATALVWLAGCVAGGHQRGRAADRSFSITPEARLMDESGGAQANAKLVFRTLLSIDGPEGERHHVPLKRRKAFDPLVRKAEVSNLR